MKGHTNKPILFVAYILSVAGWLNFVFSNSLKSKVQSAAQSSFAEGVFAKLLELFRLSDNAEVIAEIAVRKAAHVIEFFVLTLLLLLLFSLFIKSKKALYIYSASVAAACACIDESLQIISNRGASVKDVLIDLAGVAIAVIICRLIKY